MTVSLEKLCQNLDLTFHGDPQTAVAGVTSLDRLEAGKLVMVETAEQLARAQKSEVSAILHPEKLEVTGPGIGLKEPRIAFARLLDYFHPAFKPEPGVCDTATVDSRANIDPTAFVGPHCVVGAHSSVGAHAVLAAFVVLEEGASVGDHSILQPHVVVGAHGSIGNDCQLEPWCKLGENAVLADGVDLGAHTAVANEARIEAGAKVDNLVIVGPRSVVGPGSILVGQSAVDRDATLHAGVVVAGQGAVGPEAVLHSGVQIGGRSLALGTIDKPGPYWGNPAIPFKEEMKRISKERKAAGEAD